MKENKKIIYIIGGVIFCLFVYNIGLSVVKGTLFSYIKMPIYNIVNCFIAFFIAYVFAQARTDFRKNKDVACAVIDRILVDLSDSRMHSICNESDINFVRLRQRSINNRLELLKNFQNIFDIRDGISYTQKEYQAYWDFFSNHIYDIEYLKKSSTELMNHIQNMSNQLEKLIIDIQMQ